MVYTLQNIEYVGRGKPDIWIFARDEDKSLKRFIVKGFEPYFWIKKNEEYKVSGMSDIRKTMIKGKGIFGEDVLKVNTTRPKDVVSKRKVFSKTWESDVFFVKRYMIDKGLFSTFEWDEENEMVKPVKADPTPPKIFYLDIEVDMPKTESPDPFGAEYPITCISIYDSYTEEMITLINHDSPDKIEYTGNLEMYDSEREMLKAFMAKIQTIKPDVLTGWYITGFDIPYIVRRLTKNKLNKNKLSPLGWTDVSRRNTGYRGVNCRIKGLTILDMLSCYKKFFAKAFPSYALQAIAQKDLGESKVRIDDFHNAWKNNPTEVIKRNISDVEFLYRIDDKWGLIAHYTELKNSLGTGYDDVLSSKRLIDIKMLRKAKDMGVVLPKGGKRGDSNSYLGAYVMYPKSGIWENVIVLDFSSLYPNIFINYNISPETLTDKIEDVYKIGKWHFKKKPVGILPDCVTELQKRRADLKSEMINHSPNSSEYKRLDTKQKTTKYLINAFYGVMGYPAFRLYNRVVAECVTIMGQEYVKSTVNLLEKWGYKVLYGDTDSVFVVIEGDTDEAFIRGRELETKLTHEVMKKLGASIDIEFEKLYSKILFGNVKKRYAGIKIWDGGQHTDKLDVTGFEVKRSDTAPISIDVQKEIMNIMLKSEDPEDEIRELLLITKARFKKVDLIDIAIPKGMTKDPEEYGGLDVTGGRIGVPANVRGAKYANKHFGTTFKSGSKPRMVYVKRMPEGYEPTDVISFDEDTNLPDDIVVDYDKMWNKIIIRKVQPLLDIINRKFKDVMWKRRQVSLAEFV
jgi:DNA polymerase I